MLALVPPGAPAGAVRLADRRVPRGLRGGAHHRRVLPPARRLPRLSLAGATMGQLLSLPMLLVGIWLIGARPRRVGQVPPMERRSIDFMARGQRGLLRDAATRSPISPPRRRSARFRRDPRALGGDRSGSGMGRPDPVLLAEAGPGRGTLMADALRAIAAGGARHFAAALRLHLIETSPRLRADSRRGRCRTPTWHDLAGRRCRRGRCCCSPTSSSTRCRSASSCAAATAGRSASSGGPMRRAAAIVARLALRARSRGARRRGRPSSESLANPALACLRSRALGRRLRPPSGGAALFLDYGPERSTPGDSLQAMRERPPGRSARRTRARPTSPRMSISPPSPTRRARGGAAVHGPVPQGVFLARARPVPAHRPPGARPAAGARAGADRGGAAPGRARPHGAAVQGAGALPPGAPAPPGSSREQPMPAPAESLPLRGCRPARLLHPPRRRFRRAVRQPQLQPLRRRIARRRCWRTAPAPPLRIGADPARLLGLTQVHGAEVVRVDRAVAAGDGPARRRDGDRPPGHRARHRHRRLRPVLLADPEAGVIGAAHAGWRGAVAGVLEATVAAMVGARRRRRARIAAAIGPCIAQASYEVARRPARRRAGSRRRETAFFAPGRRPGSLAVRPGRLLRGPAARRRGRRRSTRWRPTRWPTRRASSATAAARSRAAARSATRSPSSRCYAVPDAHLCAPTASVVSCPVSLCCWLAACGDLPRPFQGAAGRRWPCGSRQPPAGAARGARARRRAAARRRQPSNSPARWPKRLQEQEVPAVAQRPAHGRLAAGRHRARAQADVGDPDLHGREPAGRGAGHGRGQAGAGRGLGRGRARDA